MAFAQLPVAVIVNSAVLVLHGGIDDRVTLQKLRSAPRGIERSTIERTTRAQIGRVTALLRKRAVDPMTLEMMRVQDEARNKPPFNAPPFTNIVFTTKLPAGAWAFIAQNTSRPTGAKPA